MSNTSDIWFAFARTFSVLFVVLALLILVFYLIKRMSASKGSSGGRNLIQVLSIHHLSPKEKLVLVDVPGKTLLVGVTPSKISALTTLDEDADIETKKESAPVNFSQFLSQKLATSLGKTSAEKNGNGVSTQ